jgi:ribosomal protein S25
MSKSNKFDKLHDSYNQKIKKMKKYDQENDPESAHEVQDEIYEKIIKDIVKNKFTDIDQVKEIAEIINKNIVSKQPKLERWYA